MPFVVLNVVRSYSAVIRLAFAWLPVIANKTTIPTATRAALIVWPDRKKVMLPPFSVQTENPNINNFRPNFATFPNNLNSPSVSTYGSSPHEHVLSGTEAARGSPRAERAPSPAS